MTLRTGDARNPSTKYKTSRYCVAYLDFLGGTDIIRHDDQNKHLNIINMIFADALSESKIFARDVFVKIFSDNILLAMPIDVSNRKESIETIVGLVINIIQEAADYNYLMRGAITEGLFFCNDIFVYGKALIETVTMEKDYAIYPRVIATEEVAESLRQYFYLCTDGWYMVNHYVNTLNSAALRYKLVLLAQLRTKKNNLKEKQKLMWAINNFNVVNRLLNFLGPEHIITPEEIKNSVK